MEIIYPLYTPTHVENIRRLRYNLMVHSYIYYRLGTSIISDEMWDQMAIELVELQSIHGNIINFYDKEFEDWDASTGFHLPRDDQISNKAEFLIKLHENRSKYGA